MPDDDIRTWMITDAKHQLGEVIRTAKTEGPQRITVRGKTAAYLLPIDLYAAALARLDEEDSHDS
ncbi:MAG: type II toxin-antitoxin system prevent-host-death family antitoxin [Dehalococcoidia bacterium]